MTYRNRDKLATTRALVRVCRATTSWRTATVALNRLTWRGLKIGAIGATVVAGLALVVSALCGPRFFCGYRGSKSSRAAVRGQQFVEAHQEWSLDNDGDCPGDLDELTELMNSKGLTDPWGRDYLMVCGDLAPKGIPFGVASAGEDAYFGTQDDIKSWEGRKKRKY